MVNKTELMALEWLEKRGYKQNEIIKNYNKSPDFICPDGKRYEVKLLYGKQIVFQSSQTKNLKDDDIILVFDKTKFITKFLWKDKKSISFNIVVGDIKNFTTILISRKTRNELKNIGKKGEDYNTVIERLVEHFKTIRGGNQNEM